jgi:hypothetical protein
MANCVNQLAACGYPSPSTVVVPAGATLTPVAQATFAGGRLLDELHTGHLGQQRHGTGLTIDGSSAYNRKRTTPLKESSVK